jgi:hypothetical protein
MSYNKSIISLSAIPKLRNRANFAARKQAVENQLLLAGCIGIIDGSDMELFRTATAMAARSARAGSAPPTAKERIPETDLTVEQLEEWRKWQKREEKLQGAAQQMWDYILATHQLDSPQEKHVRDALATIRLKEILRQRRWRYILNDSTLFYCTQGPHASRLMRRKDGTILGNAAKSSCRAATSIPIGGSNQEDMA